MKNQVLSALSIAVFLACCFQASARPQEPAKARKTPAATASRAASQKEGERRFRENCDRCHNPPESLSPREVKAVLQHMRVRAMLSAEDEQLILKYLAP
jgi:cytochrome c5